MRTVLVSSAIGLSAISILLWQLFGGNFRKQAEVQLTRSESFLDPPKVLIWESIWREQGSDENKTNIGWIFTIARRNYDSDYRQTLLNRRWKGSAKPQDAKGERGGRDFDGMREKRASSIVTYFCLFVLVLSLIRAALDMNSNLQKSREENVNKTINLDSRRCSLNDFKMAQAQLKKKEQSQRRANLLCRAMTIVESPLNNLTSKDIKGQNLTADKEKLERQASVSDTGSTSDSPSKLRSRFSTSTATPSHLRRMSFPALRRGSSMEVVVHADVDDLIAHHSPEVKRRMRLLRH